MKEIQQYIYHIYKMVHGKTERRRNGGQLLYPISEELLTSTTRMSPVCATFGWGTATCESQPFPNRLTTCSLRQYATIRGITAEHTGSA